MNIESYQLTNCYGLKLTVLNYGAIIQALTTVEGKNLVLGYTQVEDYLTTGNPYFYGAVMGRLANRVANAAFTISSEHFQLECNENQRHCLHSGPHGLHNVFWQVITQTDRITLHYHSVDGEAGFPGNVDFRIEYRLTDENALIIDYQAIPDRLTPIDLTNHTYWNLSPDHTILHDDAEFFATHYLDVDHEMIPTGKQLSVNNTALDFTQPKTIGSEITLLNDTHGYDHYFVGNIANHSLKKLATINDSLSKISLNVYSTELGFQFYTGNFLATPYRGFCVETQNYPNAINQASFPSPLVSPDKPYQQRTIYQLNLPGSLGVV